MTLETKAGAWEVEAVLSERVEPLDGKCHVSGRIAPHPEVAALVRAGVRDANLDGLPVRLAEVDPWGGVLIRAVRY